MDDVKQAIAACAEDPQRFREIDPYLFEAVVAELLAGFGWRVNLTPASRDGGYDILGVTTDRSGLETSWLVECKRYQVQNRVGVELARQLVGVKSHLGVPNAVLVTSASFTKGVQELCAARRDLSLVDGKVLGAWAVEYMPRSESTYAAEQSFASCFISHSSMDSEFAEKLAARLRSSGVPVWYAPDDIEPGAKIYEQLKQAIGSFDRLVVILSSKSIESPWVQTELALALARERNEKRRVLFPVAIASIDEIQRWECVDPDSGVDVARELRSYFIPDFSNWKDSTAFEEAASRIVGALQTPQDGAQDRSGPKLPHELNQLEKELAEYQGRFAEVALEHAFDLLLEGEDLLTHLTDEERYNSYHILFAHIQKAQVLAAKARQEGDQTASDVHIAEGEALLDGFKKRIAGIRVRK